MDGNDKKTSQKTAPHFNVLDGLIVFLVVLCVAGIIFRGNIKDTLGFGEELGEYMVTFSLTGIDSTLPDYLDEGDRLYLSDGGEAGRLLGVADFSIHTKEYAGSSTLLLTPASVYVNDNTGKVVLATYPEGTIVDADGAFTCSGAYGDEGYFRLGGESYLAVGQRITLYTDKVTLNITVTSISPIQ